MLFKSNLIYEALLFDNISDNSQNNKSCRKTVYIYRDKSKLAINQHFEPTNDDTILYNIPATKDLVETAVITLSGVCKVSECDIQTAINYLDDYPISVGSIKGVLNKT